MDKSSLLLLPSMTFMVANSSLGAMLSDWLYVRQAVQHGDCIFYNGATFNLFGAICGVDIRETESYVKHMQILTGFTFAFSLLLYFMTLYRKAPLLYIKLLATIICILASVSVVLWQVSTRSSHMPSDEYVSYYGVGWFFTIVTIICSIIILIV